MLKSARQMPSSLSSLVRSMKGKEFETANFIFQEIKKGVTYDSVSSIKEMVGKERTEKISITKTPFLNSVGKELGKLLIEERCELDELLKLWKLSKAEDKKLEQGLKGGREIRLIIVSALGEVRKKESKLAEKFLLEIIQDLSDWEVCDQLALRVLSNLATKDKHRIFSLMGELVKSENKWIRRLAIATIPPYIRANRSESKLCLEFLCNVMEEKDKDVQRAVAWALREISKKDSNLAFEFLKKWAKADSKDAKKIVREGMRKLSEVQQEDLRKIMGLI